GIRDGHVTGVQTCALPIFGASLLDGYMEDLATVRIYRLMIAQRIRHSRQAEILDDSGTAVAHTPELISRLFDEELDRLLQEQKRSEERRVGKEWRDRGSG